MLKKTEEKRMCLVALCLALFVTLILSGRAALAQVLMQESWQQAGCRVEQFVPSVVVNVQQFGAVGDSATDNRAAFVNAINSLGGKPGIVLVPAGKFRLTRGISLPEGVVLRGLGHKATSLIFDFGTSGDNGISVNGSKLSAQVSLVGSAVRGTREITLATTLDIRTGDYLLLTQENPWETVPATAWANRSPGQLVAVRYVNGNTVHLAEPLNMTFGAVTGAKVQIARPRRFVGIENIRLRRMANATGVPSNISFTLATNCWVKGVESHFSASSHVMIAQSSHITVSGNYIHDGFVFDGTGTRGYGVTMIQQSTNCLVENNIFRRLRHAITCKEGANGNVVAYNYCREPWRVEIPQDGGADCLLHGYWPTANLYEGNIGQFFQASATWGPAGPHNTVFRNRFQHYGIFGSQVTTGTNQTQSDSTNVWCNEATGTGSVMGFPLGITMWLSHINSLFGNFSTGSLQGSVANPPVGATMLSLYRNTKPDWWPNSIQWAKIGWPNAVNSGTIPAYERWLSGNNLVMAAEAPTSAPQLIIDSWADVIGTYKSITVQQGGSLNVTGALQVDSAITVMQGGTIIIGNANITGNASIRLLAGSKIVCNNTSGIWRDTTVGPLQLSGVPVVATESEWVFNGGANANTGNLLPASVQRLTLNTAGLITLNKSVTVEGQLVLHRGQLTTADGVTLTIGGSASIPEVVNGAGIAASSRVIVKRAWPEQLRTWRGRWVMVSPVTQNQTVDSWAQHNPFVANTYNASGTSSIFFYNPLALPSAANGYVKPDSARQVVPVGQGARVWVNPNKPNAEFMVNGQPIIGPVSLSLRHCQSGCTFQSPNGWNLIGNPYLAPISWDKVTSRTSLANAVHMWDWQGRRWRAYVNGIGTNGWDGTILPGQGFMVLATSPTASLQLTETCKTEVLNSPLSTPQQEAIRLVASTDTTAESATELVIYQQQGASATYQNQYDALAFNTEVASLISPDGHQLSIKALPSLMDTLSGTKLTVDLKQALNQLQLSGLPSCPTGYQWTVNNHQGQSLATSSGDGISGPIVLNQLAAGQYTLQLTGPSLKSSQYRPYPNPFAERLNLPLGLVGHPLKVMDLTGRVFYDGSSPAALETTAWPAGVYILVSEDSVTRVVKR